MPRQRREHCGAASSCSTTSRGAVSCWLLSALVAFANRRARQGAAGQRKKLDPEGAARIAAVSPTMIPENHDDLHTLAGQYVLGVLDAAEAGEVAEALATHTKLRRAVAFWEEKLHPLAQIVPPAEPPADLWQEIETRI